MTLTRREFGLGALGLAVAAPHAPTQAQGQAGDVDLLLVLLNDGSGSIDADEYRLQREGTAAALERPEILNAIARTRTRSIAVAYGEWGSPGAPQIIVPWTRIAGADDAAAFAERLMAEPRRHQSWNAIGDAIAVATGLIAAAPFRSARATIDIAGDGPDMRSSILPAAAARDRAVAAGITINGLVIAAEGSGSAMPADRLRAHFEDNVIGGPGAFVVTARDRTDFAYAIFNKMVRELS
jgi:hypothetical protein